MIIGAHEFDALWTKDAQDKQDLDFPVIQICTRFYGRDNTAKPSIWIGETQLVEHQGYIDGGSEAETKRLTEQWIRKQVLRITNAVEQIFEPVAEIRKPDLFVIAHDYDGTYYVASCGEGAERKVMSTLLLNGAKEFQTFEEAKHHWKHELPTWAKNRFHVQKKAPDRMENTNVKDHQEE